MKDSNPLLDQVVQKIEQSQNNLPTEAGHHNASFSAGRKEQQKEQLIDTINQSFELLRINYHHLYFSAYSEIDALNAAKRLWMESLTPFSPTVILNAVQATIKTSDYLPTISRIIRACMDSSGNNHSLPNVHSAYIEACNAPAPRENVKWSHPAVYHAGKKTNWFFMANNSEKIVFPIFKSHYEALYQRVINGEELTAVMPFALPLKEANALSKEENIQRMEKMRSDIGI